MMRAYPIRDQTLRDQIAEYRTTKDTLNDALRNALYFADIALKSGFKPKNKFPRDGTSLWLDPKLVEDSNLLLLRLLGINYHWNNR